MAQVTLHNLSKSYIDRKGSAVTAVDGVNLAIADGEFMVLVGPSGCGKSTTLRMIAGLEEITSGTVAIGEGIVNDQLPKDRGIAMVFQNYALYPHMSVFDNMAFSLKLSGMPRPEIQNRVTEAARTLGLENLLDRRPAGLSGGQRQRVAVGRAIVRKPKVFLFDEPLSNLDAKMRVSMRTEISQLHARLKATMIYVTHDQVEAMTMGDRICVMKDGRIMQIAKPLELYNQPVNLFVAGFIGSPPMNFFTGTLSATGTGWEFVETNERGKPFVVPLPTKLAAAAQAHLGRRIVLGIRPEHIKQAESTHLAHGEATVDISEPMGAETHVHLNSGATRFIARLEPTAAHRPGHTLAVSMVTDGLNLFDGESELAIR